jgi:hypothetical protein
VATGGLEVLGAGAGAEVVGLGAAHPERTSAPRSKITRQIERYFFITFSPFLFSFAEKNPLSSNILLGIKMNFLSL